MKATGIVRNLDSLGRIVLPIELRNNLGLTDRSSVEIYVEEDRIILRKYAPADIFNGDFEDLVEYKGAKVSKNSIRELAELAGFEITDKN